MEEVALSGPRGRPLRVALVAHGFPPRPGGVERHVAELARAFVARGIGVEVVTCDPTGRLPRREVVDGAIVHRFPTLFGDGVFNLSPRLGVWLMRNAARFDLLHAHSYHTPLAFQALVAARAAGRPFVLTPHYHGTGHSPLRRALHVPYRLIGALAIRGSRPLICVSSAERALLQRHFGDAVPTVIAPNGVEVAEILAARPFEAARRGRLVLAAGRLEDYKQVDVTISAMAHLPPEDELVVLGSGPAHGALEERIAALGLTDRVRLLGHVPVEDLRRWMRSADVFVTLSRHEAYGISLLEAGVAGAGVVATAIPAHREVAAYLPAGTVEWVPVDVGPERVSQAIAAARRREHDEAELIRVPRWADTAERTLEAYLIALRGGSRATTARAA